MTKVNFALAFVSTVISIYMIEVLLFLLCLWPLINNAFKPDKIIAKQVVSSEESIDPRTSFDVLMDLRRVGIDAYPFLKSSSKIALSGISRKPTILCEESGYHLVYNSDEHGFNNPEGSWAEGEAEIVVIGDSFVHGWCVRPGEDIPGQIRKISGKKTLNLGVSGNDPLDYLAILKEYAGSLKPSIVIWVQSEYDARDLTKQLTDKKLLKYLDDEYSQDLINRQAEIDEILIRATLSYIEDNVKKELLTAQKRSEREFLRKESIETQIKLASKEKRMTAKGRLWQKIREEKPLTKIAKLHYLRQRLKGGKVYLPSHSHQMLKVFRQILKTAKSKVSSWGGRLYFVYLPSIDRYNTQGVAPCWRQEILSIVRSLDIPIIDMHKEVFAVHPDPLSLFPLRVGVHYNAQGYNLTAQAIVDRLKKDKLLK